MIDEKSMEILKILQEKARISNIEVSRQVKLAPSAVLERIRKMEKSGIIDGYEVRLNPQRFDCSQVSFIYVYVHNHFSQTGEANLISLPEIQEVHFISGEDCYLIKVRTANTGELGALLQEKILQIPGVISTKSATVLKTLKETAQIPIR